MLQEHSFKVRCAVDEQNGQLLGKIEYCGGDHDVYDYCVDDPVSLKDPTGLIPEQSVLDAKKLSVYLENYAKNLSNSPVKAYNLVKKVGRKIAGAGLYGAAYAADHLGAALSGKEVTTAARDGVKKGLEKFDEDFYWTSTELAKKAYRYLEKRANTSQKD